jgi:hypothetical protein
VTVVFELRSPCWLCGYRLRGGVMRTVRINKHSLRDVGRPGLAWWDPTCPECQWPTTGTPWTFHLTPADRAKVDAARARRGWAPLPEQVAA